MVILRSRLRYCLVAVAMTMMSIGSDAHAIEQDTHRPFHQLEAELPTPGDRRTASGAPGHRYWQQQVDYQIDVEIDDARQHLSGKEKIRYTNNSPDTLRYLWLQLDANIYAPDADSTSISRSPDFDRMSYRRLSRVLAREAFDGSVCLTRVEARGRSLTYTVVKTMMRLDLPKPLAPGKIFEFEIDWNYAINNSKEVGGRTGFEPFDDGNRIYEIAQWFPRLAAYEDVNGWQHKQYLGAGEFTLEFGDYDVRITLPDDFVVAATGVLTNERKVLSKTQRERLEHVRRAGGSQHFIITPEEAVANHASQSSTPKTWRFEAKNVRDFAFAASRKFIWDAIRHHSGENDVMAMSFYPPEGEPLWSRYSTKAIVHAIAVYSRYTFPYPYPTAISVNGPVGGMEYPMISFNGPRPEKDKSYSKRTKYGLISVIIHEVGHNFFPMIVNSDERQWTWMDEGINTFLQYLAEQEWESGYPSRRGAPRDIVGYMRGNRQVPIMTGADSLLHRGNNAYGKPATALNILRETILGRDIFDFAFKEYARRWKFKRPMPSDFFRTIEDASGVDLDWFWRGWFYTTAHTDIALTKVTEYTVDSKDPTIEKLLRKQENKRQPNSMTERRNRSMPRRVDEIEGLRDFYNRYDALDVTSDDIDDYNDLLEQLDDGQRGLLLNETYFYVLEFKNVGGLVMPLILDLEMADGSIRNIHIPAEIWLRQPKSVSKLITSKKKIVRFTVDPRQETADTDLSNNRWPPQLEKTRFELFLDKKKTKNPMQKAAGASDIKAKARP